VGLERQSQGRSNRSPRCREPHLQGLNAPPIDLHTYQTSAGAKTTPTRASCSDHDLPDLRTWASRPASSEPKPPPGKTSPGLRSSVPHPSDGFTRVGPMTARLTVRPVPCAVPRHAVGA
jgi:hypothetical protein